MLIQRWEIKGKMTIHHDQLKVAAIQMISTPRYQDNLETTKRLVVEAATKGARFVILPEFFIQITVNDNSRRFDIAEELGNGPTQDELSFLAQANQIYLLAGTLLIKSKSPGKFYNTTLLYAPDGSLVTSYNKIHLFKFDDGANDYDESKAFLSGDKIVTCEVDGYKIGLAICYDLRFPELFRAMGVVDAILLPSAFTDVTGQAHWEVLVRARAIENQCYFIAVNQGGAHETARMTYGHTMICDPWGEVVSSCAKGINIVYGLIDKAKINEVRTRLPALEHRLHNI